MQPLFWAVAGVILGPYLFYRGFLMLQLKRRVINAPRSAIRSAAIGLVEISGKAVGPYTLVAPLSKEECLYYRLMVAADPDDHLSKKSSELCAPLFLDDGTGVALVSPFGADIRLNVSHQKGNLRRAMDGYRSGRTPEFIEEFSIKPGDNIFVLGTLQENKWIRRRVAQDDDRNDELSRVGPGFVGEAEADLLRRGEFAFLDLNAPSGVTVETKQKFDLNPPTILAQGDGPFIISSESERELLTKLSWKSLLCIWGGPIAALWGVWELVFVKPGLIGSPFTH